MVDGNSQPDATEPADGGAASTALAVAATDAAGGAPPARRTARAGGSAWAALRRLAGMNKLGLRLGRSCPSPIGIDVGTRSVKAVQLERVVGPRRPAAAGGDVRGVGDQGQDAPGATSAGGDAGRWRVAAALSVPRTEASPVMGAAEAARLAEVLERQGFVGQAVVLGVPGDRLLTSVLELPPRSSQAPIEQLARVELARAHKCAPEAMEMGCWDLPAPVRASRATHVMAVACTHAAAEAVLAPFEAAGLDVRAMDVKDCAIARAVAALGGAGEGVGTGTGAEAGPPGAGITAILDLGWGAASLSLLHGGVIVYSRSIAEAGVGRLHEALSRRLRVEGDVVDYLLNDGNLFADESDPANEGPSAAGGETEGEVGAGWETPDEARRVAAGHAEGLARELMVSFSYVTHQYPSAPVRRLLVVGGGGSLAGLAEHLAALLAVPCHALAPADVADCPPALAALARSAALTAAAGLAMFPDV